MVRISIKYSRFGGSVGSTVVVGTVVVGGVVVVVGGRGLACSGVNVHSISRNRNSTESIATNPAALFFL